MSEDRQILEAKEYYQYLGKKRAHVLGQLVEAKQYCTWARKEHMCLGNLQRPSNIVFGQGNAPVLADELNTVVDEDQGDFAELCLLFCVQERVVQRVAQLLQDWQENSELLRRVQITLAF